MENCELIDLVAYLEGDDPDGTIASHLKQCQDCRQALAEFEKLIPVLKAWREEQEGGCIYARDVVRSIVEGTEVDARHLAQCPPCRDLHAMVRLAMEEVESHQVTQALPLPEKVLAVVEARKKKWQAEKLSKVLDLQGVRDEKERERLKQQAMDQGNDNFLKAAFSDDLLEDSKENGNNEDTDS